MNRDDEQEGMRRVPRAFVRPMGAGSEVRSRQRLSEVPTFKFQAIPLWKGHAKGFPLGHRYFVYAPNQAVAESLIRAVWGAAKWSVKRWDLRASETPEQDLTHSPTTREWTDAHESGGYEVNGAKMRVAVEDYDSADAALRLHRVGRNGMLGHNTRLVRDNVHTISVILHNTRIVTYHDNGMISLDSGGYQTVTTKARMNEVLPLSVRVFQAKGKWFVQDVRGGGPRLDFFDGMTVQVR